MTEPAHYKRGPSSAARWLICTDAPEAEVPFPDSTSDAADEGTAAHWLLEQCLKSGHDAEPLAGSLGGLVKAGEDTGCEKDWPITGEMVEAVQLAIDTVTPDVKKRGTKAFFEERVRLDHALGLSEPVGGTADIILYLPKSKVLKVFDFKYGRGHVVEVTAGGTVYQEQDDGGFKEVSAKDVLGFNYNPQLAVYALAAMVELERLLGGKREVKWIELGVIQPRAHHKKGPVRTKKLAPLQLMALESRLVEAVQGERKRIAGDHCLFCRAQRDCEARRKAIGSAATADFSAEDTPNVPAPKDAPRQAVNLQDALSRPPKGLPLATLGEVRQHLPELKQWIKEVEEEIRTRLLNDLKVPGARLGQGRGSRPWGGSWDDQQRAADATAEAGYANPEDLFEPPKLKSVAQIEKIIGKAKFKETPLANLVTYVEGGPVVVDEDSDKPDYVKDGGFEAESPDDKHPLL